MVLREAGRRQVGQGPGDVMKRTRMEYVVAAGAGSLVAARRDSVVREADGPGERLRRALKGMEALELVARGSRGQVEAVRDREMLVWISRFRFVTVDELALRFGVSTRSANARVSRMRAAGLVGCQRELAGQRRAVFITGPACRLLGLPVRRAPRPEVHRVHELGIANLAARHELDDPDVQVLTEREGRRVEAEGGRRCSVDAIDPSRGLVRRWPDLILEGGRKRVAIEIEIAEKGTDRLAQIVADYALSDAFGEVRFLVATEPLARRLFPLCRRADHQLGGRTALIVAPWDGVGGERCERIRGTLGELIIQRDWTDGTGYVV